MTHLRSTAWLAAPAALAASILGLVPLRDHDAWWHLAVGQLIALHRAIPDTNPFSFTAPADAPVVIQPWIGQLWLLDLYALGGMQTVLTSRNILAAIAIAIVTYVTYRRSRNVLATVVGALALALVCIAVAAATPSMFALVLGALLVAAIFAVWDGKRPRLAAAAAVGLAAAWANIASGFLLPAGGFAAAALAAVVVGDRKRARPFVLGCVPAALATLLTPWGTEIYSSIRLDVVVLAVLTMAAIPIVASRHRAEVPAEKRRLAPILTGLVVFAASALTQPLFAWHPAVMTTLHRGAVRSSAPHAGIVPADLPVEPLQILAAWGSRPRVFSSTDHAGYIAFELNLVRPRGVVWDDPVLTLPGAGQRELARMLEDAPGSVWRGAFQQYDVRAVVITEALHGALARELANAPLWDHAYDERGIHLFVRQNPPPNKK